jgi:hypothetical protein
MTTHRWPYPKANRSWPTYLHWWAEGDEFPGRTPTWLLDHWPAMPLHRLVCRIWGHVNDGPDKLTRCIWCDALFIQPPQWTECPSGGRTPIKLTDDRAKCPTCEFTYSTLMDRPALPRHWISRDGQCIRIGGQPP